MHTIGNTGKRAQNLGQHHQQRYQINYGNADTTPLTSRPRRPVAHVQPQIASSAAPPLADAPPVVAPPAPLEIQSPDEPVAIVQREETSNPPPTAEGAGDTQLKPEQVAERVYALFKRDMRHTRERIGKKFGL